MKLSTSMAEIIAEFSALNRTPGFKPVTNCPPSNSGGTTPVSGAQYDGSRRQSTVITVGVDKVPTVQVELSTSRKSRPQEMKFRKNRRQSAPCISTVARSTCFKEKMNRLKSTNSSGDERSDIEEETHEDRNVNNRRPSATSYRVA